jgi:acetyl esterase/lipase
MSWEGVKAYREGCKKSDDIRDAGLTVPDDIERSTDLRYGPFPENVLDVYVPKGTAEKLPVIISVHGGGWVYGDKELYQHYCMRLAERGFAVVNFTYRLAPENKYPAALEDCFAVFRWVKEKGSAYFLDLKNIFMVGDSAGAQLAQQCLTILTNGKFAKLFDLDIPEDFRVRACALNCGAYYMPISRFFRPSDRFLLRDYLPEDHRPYVVQFKVARNMTEDFPPAFVMTAENDFLKFMAEPLCRRLRKLGVECEYRIYGSKERKDIGHVFHVNCRLEEAKICNDDECAFFRKHCV